MQGLPLALATAGAYLLKSTWTFERYLEEYEKRWNVSPRRPLQLREYQDRTLYTTWDLSYRRLREEDTDAARLLKLLAYFDNQRIWFDLMHAGITDGCPEWLVAIAGDASDFESIMMMLTDYCFVEPQLATQSYSLHACVHDWTLAALNQHVELWSYWYALDCIHQSDNDFFLSRGLALLASPANKISSEPHTSSLALSQAEIIGQCQANLYWSCLTYIITEDVKVDDTHFDDRYPTSLYEKREKKRKELVSGWPLIHYATINLFVHGGKATSYRGGELSEQIRLLEQIMAHWIRVYRVFDEYSSKRPHWNTTILHATASADIIDIIEHQIRNNFDVNIQDEEGHTVLLNTL